MDREAWNERYATKELIWTDEANRFLVEQCEALTPGRALDLGAGEGRNAVWLAQRGWDVLAVDFSDVGLSKGRALAASHGVDVSWQQHDVTAWTPPERRFELVAILYLHLPTVAMNVVLEGAAAAVAPGGTLLVVGHARVNIERGVGGPQDPSILYQPEDLTAALVGLEVERAEVVERPVERETGPAVALDTLIRARRPAAP